MDLLSLLSGGNLASANGPDGLIGDDDLRPVGDLGLESGELLADDIDGLAGLTLLQGLSAAPDHTDAVLGGVLGFEGNNLVALTEDGAALGVAQDGPVDAAVLELGDGDFAGESAIGFVVDVLGGNFEALAEVLADEEEMQVGRRDDDLYSEKNKVVRTIEISRLRLSYRQGTLGEHLPTLGSRVALFRFSTISLMDEMDPFLISGIN